MVVSAQKQSILAAKCPAKQRSAKQRLPLIESSVERQVDTSALLVTKQLETEMYPNGVEQRVKQLKRVDRQQYSHTYHWPPQQQYKSKSRTIAIILKLIFVSWDSWTYRIGY